MANEITFTASLTINNPLAMGSNPASASWNNLQFNQTADNVIGPSGMEATTAGVAVPLGGVVAPRWAAFQNLDPTNYIEIFNGNTFARNTCLARLLGAGAGAGPYGDPMIVPLPPDCVPYAKANTANCQILFMIGDT